MRRTLLSLLAAGLLTVSPAHATADTILVAAASNFAAAVEALAERFEAHTGHTVTLTFGSTGKHYAQIKNGAPFDAFFAADVERPKRLAAEGLARPASRFTYAVGKLVLWSPVPGYVDDEGRVLERGEFRHLAVANPKLAPYGRAAQEVLKARGRWDALRRRMVRAENIGQTYQFVHSGNAELGFVARSQLQRPGQAIAGSFWEIPQSLYSPIEQQAVLLTENDAARLFMAYVRSDEARELIADYGYGLP